MQLGKGHWGPYTYLDAKFDSITLVPQGEAVIQECTRLGVVLETEVLEEIGKSPSGRCRTQGSLYPGMEQTLAPGFQFWKKGWSLVSLLEPEDNYRVIRMGHRGPNRKPCGLSQHSLSRWPAVGQLGWMAIDLMVLVCTSEC